MKTTEWTLIDLAALPLDTRDQMQEKIMRIVNPRVGQGNAGLRRVRIRRLLDLMMKLMWLDTHANEEN